MTVKPEVSRFAVVGDRLLTVGLLGLCLVHIASFWGQAARLLPAPLDEWHDIYYRLLGPWWNRSVPLELPAPDKLAVYRAIEAFVLGLLVPAFALRLVGRSLSDTGFGPPNRLGGRFGVACLLLVVPVGFYLSAAVPEPWGSPLYEAMELSAMVPEHFLLFGVVISIALPGRRLSGLWRDAPVRTPHEPGHAPPLGTGAPASARSRLLSRVGLSGREALAVWVSGVLFYLVHVGGPWPLETSLAFPLGLLFAYVTVRTGSIWPGLVAHWALNLVPLAWQTLGISGAG